MLIVQKSKDKAESLPAKELEKNSIKALSSELARKIVYYLMHIPTYPKDLAKKINCEEQKVYYHIRKLENAGIIDVVRQEIIHGTLANIYAPKAPAFVIKFSDFKISSKIEGKDGNRQAAVLEPFIENGELNAIIIVGSPDPHGPEMARSKDGYYGMDFALFLGSYLNFIPELNVKLDTEIRNEDLQKNIIVIGGPVVNTITQRINDKLPIKFDRKNNWCIYSTLTENKYLADETGIIVKTKNPFNPKKQMLLLAGKRNSGTRAAIISFLKKFEELCKGNKKNPKVFAKVVEGRDLNADGFVDEVEILE